MGYSFFWEKKKQTPLTLCCLSSKCITETNFFDDLTNAGYQFSAGRQGSVRLHQSWVSTIFLLFQESTGQLCNRLILFSCFCWTFSAKPNAFPDKYSLFFLHYTLLLCVAAIRWLCTGSTSGIVFKLSQECHVYSAASNQSKMRWGSFWGWLSGFF